MWTQDMDRLLYGAQFMTEKIGGSDAGAAELTAVRIGGFTAKSGSAPTLTANVAVLLARPEGAQAGGRGLGLFLMPECCRTRTRNSYRIVRFKTSSAAAPCRAARSCSTAPSPIN